MFVSEIMLNGMTKLNKLYLKIDEEHCQLFKNKRDMNHGVAFFKGNKSETYWRLVQFERNKK